MELKSINIKAYSNVIENSDDVFIGYKSDLVDKFKYELAYLLSVDDFEALESNAPDTIELLNDLSNYDDDELLKVYIKAFTQRLHSENSSVY